MKVEATVGHQALVLHLSHHEGEDEEQGVVEGLEAGGFIGEAYVSRHDEAAQTHNGRQCHLPEKAQRLAEDVCEAEKHRQLQHITSGGKHADALAGGVPLTEVYRTVPIQEARAVI